MNFANWIERLWYARVQGGAGVVCLLQPFTWLYRLGHLYRWHNIHPQSFSVPIIVVGNYTAGGSGKTPLIIAMAKALMEAGHQVGILTHGHLAQPQKPRRIQHDDRALSVGDEAMLIDLRTRNEHSPETSVWIGRPRASALAQMVADEPKLSVILVDDGLQDPSFARVGEVVWAEPESFGNAQIIPAGPLRQPLTNINQPSSAAQYRLLLADENPRKSSPSNNVMPCPRKLSRGVYRLADFSLPAAKRLTLDWAALAQRAGAGRIILVTAIARPWRVRESLMKQGIEVDHLAFPDHHPIHVKSLINALNTQKSAKDPINLVLTEKDAVKLLHDKDPFPEAWSIWVIDYEMALSHDFLRIIETWIK